MVMAMSWNFWADDLTMFFEICCVAGSRSYGDGLPKAENSQRPPRDKRLVLPCSRARDSAARLTWVYAGYTKSGKPSSPICNSAMQGEVGEPRTQRWDTFKHSSLRPNIQWPETEIRDGQSRC